MGLFDWIGEQASRANFQLSRAGNAFLNHHGAGVSTDPNAYDMWGVKKESYTPSPAYQVGKQNAPTAPGYSATQAPLVLTPAARAEYKPPAPSGATVSAVQNPATPAGAMPVDPNAERNNQAWTLYYARQKMQNPYDQAGLDARLTGGANQVNRQFANAERQVLENMAARGMVGSGQEGAASNQVAAERAGAQAAMQARLSDDWADKRNSWDSQQSATLAALLQGTSAIEGGNYQNQSAKIKAQADGINLEALQATLPSIIAKAQADAHLSQEEVRQIRWANDNAGLLAGVGLASNVLGSLGGLAAKYV